MKLSCLFGFMFTLVLPSVSQSVDDLNKKEMKELILKISQSNDSLEKANLDLSNQLNAAFQQKSEFASKNSILTAENKQLLEQVDALTKSQNNLIATISSNQETIQKLRDSLNDFYIVRDLSNGQFSSEEMEFITKSLKV